MTPDRMYAYRDTIVLLQDYACDGGTIAETHERYQEIVEHRDGPDVASRKRYSSCADLPHWSWWRIGLRFPFLNREERTPAERDFKYGVNLNRWHPKPIGPNPFATYPKDGTAGLIQPGDVLVIDTPSGGHVLGVQGRDHQVVYTAEYGQPGGALREHALVPSKTGGLVLGKNRARVLSHVRLSLALEAADGTVNLVAPDLACLAAWQEPSAIELLETRIWRPVGLSA